MSYKLSKLIEWARNTTGENAKNMDREELSLSHKELTEELAKLKHHENENSKEMLNKIEENQDRCLVCTFEGQCQTGGYCQRQVLRLRSKN